MTTTASSEFDYISAIPKLKHAIAKRDQAMFRLSHIDLKELPSVIRKISGNAFTDQQLKQYEHACDKNDTGALAELIYSLARKIAMVEYSIPSERLTQNLVAVKILNAIHADLDKTLSVANECHMLLVENTDAKP